MLSLAIQSCGNSVFPCTSLPCQTASCKTFKATGFYNPKCSLVNSSTIFRRSSKPISRNRRFRNFAVPEALTAETAAGDPTSGEGEQEPVPSQEEERAEVVVAPVEKPRLVLKFIWMEKNIGLALDQMIPGHGTVPLSPYYFWPRKDAWEELKTTLESKPWISQKKMIILLNQATDIINLWQQGGGNLTT